MQLYQSFWVHIVAPLKRMVPSIAWQDHYTDVGRQIRHEISPEVMGFPLTMQLQPRICPKFVPTIVSRVPIGGQNLDKVGVFECCKGSDRPRSVILNLRLATFYPHAYAFKILSQVSETLCAGTLAANSKPELWMLRWTSSCTLHFRSRAN